MANGFYTSNTIGKMNAVDAAGSFRGSPKVAAGKRSDSFYTSASKKSGGSVKTTAGIPGGRHGEANVSTSGHQSFKGSPKAC